MRLEVQLKNTERLAKEDGEDYSDVMMSLAENDAVFPGCRLKVLRAE